MISLDTLAGFAGSAAKALGTLTSIGAVYVGLGLPLPATVQYVDAKFATVIHSVADVKVTILEGQLRDITGQRALLRNEKVALGRTMDRASETSKAIFVRRMGEIEDALTKLTREEEAVIAKLVDGREAKNK